MIMVQTAFLTASKNAERMTIVKTKMTEKEAKTIAVKLIAQLDELALKHGEYGEVALITDSGRIYSWQTHKLENLALFIEHHGLPTGFVEVWETEAEEQMVKFWILPDVNTDDCGPSEYLQELIESIENVWESYRVEERDVEDDCEIRFVLEEHHETKVVWQYSPEDAIEKTMRENGVATAIQVQSSTTFAEQL
jgi:hypothetical protein